MKISVIGGGVVGLCVATVLAERGQEVTLFERAEAPGPASCSWWAGGMLAPWCEGESAEEPVVRLGRDAISWWSERVGRLVLNGSLVVAPPRDTADLRRFARMTECHEAVDGERIAELEPDLAGRFRQGLFFAGEGHLDPRRALADLVARLQGLGVDLRFGTEVLPQDAPGDRVVDCRGLGAAADVPDLRGVKARCWCCTRPTSRCPGPCACCIRASRSTWCRAARRLHGRRHHDRSGERWRITARSMMELLGSAYTTEPAFAEAEILETGVDARTAFPDNLRACCATAHPAGQRHLSARLPAVAGAGPASGRSASPP